MNVGRWHTTASSKILQYRHHEGQGEIEIAFRSGVTWFYPCTMAEFSSFHAAGSHGKEHHERWVKTGKGRPK